MNQYLNSVLATVKAKNRGEDEFHQAVEEVLETLAPTFPWILIIFNMSFSILKGRVPLVGNQKPHLGRNV